MASVPSAWPFRCVCMPPVPSAWPFRGVCMPSLCKRFVAKTASCARESGLILSFSGAHNAALLSGTVIRTEQIFASLASRRETNVQVILRDGAQTALGVHAAPPRRLSTSALALTGSRPNVDFAAMRTAHTRDREMTRPEAQQPGAAALGDGGGVEEVFDHNFVILLDDAHAQTL